MQAYLKLKDIDEELYENSAHLVNTLEQQDSDKKQIEEYKSNYFKRICQTLNNLYHRLFIKIIVKIKKWFHIITVKEIYSGLIFILPIQLSKEFPKTEQKHLEKCIPKIKKLMRKYQVTNIVISEILKDNSEFMQKFYNNNLIEKQAKIINDEDIMPYLIKEIVEYILKKQDNSKSIELEDLYLLIQSDNIKYKENIAYLSQYFKTINIITPHILSYQKFSDRLEEGHNAVTVTNNKKKSLRKAKWIVNFDMTSKEMKKYTIYRNATIIYINQEEIYKESAFDGLHICKAGIDMSEEIKEFFMKQHLLQQCPIAVLYESIISKKSNFRNIKEQMRRDKVTIKKLYGIRGTLADTEYKKVV